MKFTLALVVVALMAMSLAAAQEEEFGDALSEKVLADRAQIDQVLEAVGVTNVDELLKTHEENTARITQLESMVTASEGRLAKLKSAAEIGVANVDELLKKEHESLDRITELEAIVSASEKKHGKLKSEAQAAVEASSDQLSQYRSELELLKQASSLEMQRVQAELAAAVGELGACQSKPETPESMTVTCPDFADMRGDADLQECSVEFKRAYQSCSDYVKQSSKTYSATVGAAVLQAAIIASDYTVDALSVTKMWATDVAIPGTIAGVGNFGKAFFKTTGTIWESSIKPVVGPSYDEHARQHVDLAVAQLYAFYKEHVAPVLFPVISYLVNKMQGGAYWLYNATLHPNHGVVGSFFAGLLDWGCAQLSSTQVVQTRFANQDQLRVFIIFCAVSLLLLGVLGLKVATRKKAKTGLTRSYSYNA